MPRILSDHTSQENAGASGQSRTDPSPAVPTRNGERRHNRSRRGGRARRYKTSCTSMRQFSAMQIVIGLCAIFLQVGLMVNHSILSDGQQGIWTGAFFILSGVVCLVLGSKKVNFTGVMIIMCCCLVTLFVAMTLASLGWLGVEASLTCEYYTGICNETLPTAAPYPIPFTTSTTEFPMGSRVMNDSPPTKTLSALSEGRLISGFEQLLSKNMLSKQTDEDLCKEILKPGFCGHLIELPRVLYSFLMLLGVTQATVSFMMAAVACTSNTVDTRRRLRPSIAFIYENAPDGTPQRSIRAWDLPPTPKEVEAGLASPVDTPESVQTSAETIEDLPPPYE